jgi:glycosyltransferase involved in cell wall biosynthesis
MPTLRRVSCGLSIRARGLARQLLCDGHSVTFVVDAAKTDIESSEVDGLPIIKLNGSKRDPRHWMLQSLDRRDLARDLVAVLEVPHDLFISSQPEAVTAYKARHPGRPAMFVCGGTTLLHDYQERCEQNRHPLFRRAPFAVDRYLKRRAESAALHCADATVFDSEATRDLVLRAYGPPADRMHALTGAVDDRTFQPADEREKWHRRRQLGIGPGEFVATWTGRLAPEKNLSFLLTALAACQRPPETVLLVGDGPLRASLTVEARRLNVAHRIRFLGDQCDVRPFLHTADVFVFPSRGESLGLAMLEAMSCGLPVVAIKPDGERVQTACDEVLDGGRCGILVEPATPRSFAAALDGLRGDPELRKGLGLAARRRVVERYNWLCVGRQFRSVVDGLFEAKSGRSTSRAMNEQMIAEAMS